MTDEHKLRKQAERGDHARSILEDELVNEAFDALQKTIDDAWKNTIADETQQRENAYLMHRLLKQFREHFESLVNNGEAAKRHLTEIRDPRLARMFRHG